jgi:hypothetical protein
MDCQTVSEVYAAIPFALMGRLLEKLQFQVYFSFSRDKMIQIANPFSMLAVAKS